MNDFIAKLKNAPGFVSLSPATSDIICAAEEKLQVRFAADYRAYVSAFGAASFWGHELTGVCTTRLNVVSVTEKLKADNPADKNDMYVIEELHIDGITVWQNAVGEVFIAKRGMSFQKIANSLQEYLKL